VVAIRTKTTVCGVAATQTDETLVYDSFSQTDSTGASETMAYDSFGQTDSTEANETVTAVVRDASIAATVRPSADTCVVGTEITGNDTAAVQTDTLVRCTSAVTNETESVSSIGSVDSTTDDASSSADPADGVLAAIPADGDKAADSDKPTVGDGPADGDKPADGDGSADGDRPADGDKPADRDKSAAIVGPDVSPVRETVGVQTEPSVCDCAAVKTTSTLCPYTRRAVLPVFNSRLFERSEHQIRRRSVVAKVWTWQ